MPIWIGPDLTCMDDETFFKHYNEVLKEAISRLKSTKTKY